MDLSFLQTFCIPTIVGICLCVGYVIKTSLDFIPNKYIPLIMLILGLGINIFINKVVTLDVILAGMFSGLSSTGLHQMFKHLLDGNKETDEDEINK
jgi:hypothetical protein